ncbi:hypothetical protein [Actinophytocola sp.]|uniref:hypothetical protein n=1 Tax=Actinophytocola sp. TaxID=1872138 RepID=UPI002ED4D2CC
MLTQPPVRRRFGPLLVGALVLAVVAAGFLAWSVVELVSAGTDTDRARQELAAADERLADLRADDAVKTRTARDEAREAASKGVAVMNTLDYRGVDADLDAWERVSTGALHDEIVDNRARSRQAVVDARSVTKATVVSSAVQAVDARSGTATVLVAVRIDVTTGEAGPTQKYMRIRATLLRTEQGWKLDGLGQVPYQS